MTGVEILAVEEVATEFAFNWTVGLITMAIVAVVLTFILCFLVCERPDDWRCWLASAFGGVLIGVLFGTLFGTAHEIPTGYETQYKVTISDEVQLNEFNEKYEIIEQDGKIYTVRERE